MKGLRRMSALVSGAFCLSLAVQVLVTAPVHGCSRVFWPDNPSGKLVGRTLDWYEDSADRIWYMPAGLARFGKTRVRPYQWTSRYSSAVVASLNLAPVEGFNECGLGVHLLYLDGTKYPAEGHAATVSEFQWCQLMLDQCATVEEVISLSRAIPVAMCGVGRYRRGIPVHLAAEDQQGNSVIIEYLGGRMHVYQGRRFTVTTNEPPLPEQLAMLGDYVPFGGKKGLPASASSTARFARGCYYQKSLRPSSNLSEAIFSLAGVMRAVAEPPKPRLVKSEYCPTRWVSIADLTHRKLYFVLVKSNQPIEVSLEQLKRRSPTNPLVLDPYSFAGAGNATSAFTPSHPMF